jgi:hypothetical protein
VVHPSLEPTHHYLQIIQSFNNLTPASVNEKIFVEQALKPVMGEGHFTMRSEFKLATMLSGQLLSPRFQLKILKPKIFGASKCSAGARGILG